MLGLVGINDAGLELLDVRAREQWSIVNERLIPNIHDPASSSATRGIVARIKSKRDWL